MERQEICKNCIYSFEHWKSALKGILFCEQVCGDQQSGGFAVSREVEPDWYCGDFERKEEDAIRN